MPSTYVPPDVYVTQVRRTQVGTARPPSLPVVVVGPARQIVTRQNAGDFDATVDVTVPVPGLTAGGIVDPLSLQVYLDATSDSGKYLGMFVLSPSEYSTVPDASGNIASIAITGNLPLELSILSTRNNNQPTVGTADDDYGSGTPDGVTFTDASVDFLAKGASAAGDTFVRITSPASMAGSYRVLQLIPTGNTVHQLVVEKVLDSDLSVPELSKSFVINGAAAPTGSTIYGYPAHHEATVYNASPENVLTGSDPGVGVSATVGLKSSTGLDATAWGTTEIAALLAGTGASLLLPGVAGQAQVTFAPANISTQAPMNRGLAFWVDMIANVKVGDWMRVHYPSSLAIGPDSLTAINYSTGVVTFTSASFVTSAMIGRTLTISGNGAALNNRGYEIIAVNVVSNQVTVDIAPFGGVFPGGSNSTYGNGTIAAQPEVLRDFKVLSVDTVNKALVLSAQGNQSVGNDVVTLADPTIDSIKFFNVLKGSGDAINGAGDFLTFSLGGVPYTLELLSVTPTAVTTVAALPSFSALEIAVAGPQSVVSIAGSTLTFSAGFVQAGWVGLTLRLTGNATAANNGDYVIQSVNTVSNNLVLVTSGNPSWTGTGTGTANIIDHANATTIVRRGVPFRNSTATYDLRQRLTNGFVGSVLVSYTADRRDLPLNGLIEIASEQDIENNIGVIHPNNPLALGAEMIIRSGLADGNRTFYVLATAGNTLAGHLEAMDTLEMEDVYYIVPLTQEEAILSAYKAHCDAQSQPRNKHERVLLSTTTLPTYDSILPLPGTGVVAGTIVSATTFTSAAVNWGLVNPGDMLKILTGAGTTAEAIESQARILSVSTGTNTVTLLSALPSNLIGTVRDFRVDTYPLTKDEQAEAWRDYAKSVADHRVAVIRPDQVEMTYTDKTLASQADVKITAPAFYAAAAFAGLAASLPVDSPMTNVPVPGIDRLVNSNAYFKPSQLDTIAEGGNLILVQESRNSVPYARHQLTTDMTSIVTREFSITKIVDYTAKYIRNSLKPYIGNRNITAEYLTQLRGTTEAVIRALVKANILMPKTQLISLVQNPDEPDSIVIEIALDVPYPANRIYVTLFV